MNYKLFGLLAAAPLCSSVATGPGPALASSTAAANYTCHCEVYARDANAVAGPNKGIFLGTAAAYVVAGGNIPPKPDPVQCQNSCAAATNSLFQSQPVATNACGSQVPTGSLIRSWSRTVNYPYATNQQNPNLPRIANVVGTLKNTPAITKFEDRCPPTWWANSNNQAGGVTTDGQCKKLAGTMNVPPYPANGTQIGSWGFTWGNEVWVRGTTANGGAASHNNVSTPAVCAFQ